MILNFTNHIVHARQFRLITFLRLKKKISSHKNVAFASRHITVYHKFRVNCQIKSFVTSLCGISDDGGLR